MLKDALIRSMSEKRARRRSTEEGIVLSPPLYTNWDDYLARTTAAYRRSWCKDKAKKANKIRLMSEVPDYRVTPSQVLNIFLAAEGRCVHCGSLAVEKRPSTVGSWIPEPWGHIGRRIGSLEHLESRLLGGSNKPENLAWACLWCNTWPEERVRGALDHGGHYPES